MDAPAPFAPLTPDQARALRDTLHQQGRRLVFTNGCFDLLHTGHVRYLQQARALGDALIVGLNADASVRALKGPTRPVNGELDRAEVLSALRCVDGVVIFHDLRATSLIEAIQPHIYAKGGDYTPDTLDPGEREALRRAGTEIQILSLVPGRSTTSILDRMKTGPKAEGGAAMVEKKPPLRIAVLGSGKGSNLQALIQAIQSGALPAQIVAAVSDVADSAFLEIARRAGLPAQYLPPGEHPRRFALEAQEHLVQLLQKAGAEVIVLAGFMRILKKPVFDAYAGRILNIHPSLLPAHKGATAVRDALAAGDAETGCTVHLVTPEIDSGRILAQARVPILPGDDEASLHARIQEQEHRLLPQVLADWRRD
jgi:formyltetrahydrofolate-dependent phosphoribosylglycinamide formyltransferase